MLPGDEEDLERVRAEPPSRATARLTAHPARRCSACETTYSGPEEFCPFDGEPLEERVSYDPFADPLLGKTVSDRYRVEAVLGQGGMGTVYRVRHNKLESAFAMKVLHPDLLEDEEVAPRLIAEARATAAIGHPNIVSVADFGEIDSSLMPELAPGERLPYFVMEQLTGPSLAEVLELEGKLEPRRVAPLIVQIAGALGAAHKAGIIHRDLKPGNIRLSRDDVGREVAKVVDFGVAKVMGNSKKTLKGMVFGTPHYMSPEQGQGETIDARTDIYALGIILYECVAGKVPFHAETFMGVLQQHLFDEPPEPDVEPSAAGLVPVILRCLRKDPDERYAEMADVAAAIEDTMERESAAAPRSSSGRGRAAADGPRWLWAALTVVAAAVVAFLVVRYTRPPVVSGGSETAPASPTVVVTASPSVGATPRVEPVAPADVSTEPTPTSSASASAAPSPQPPGPGIPAISYTIPYPFFTPPAEKDPPVPAPKGKGEGEVVDPWE